MVPGKAFCFQAGNGVCDSRLGCPHDAFGLFPLRGLEHGDIIFRHDDLCRALILQALLFGKDTIEFCGIADLAAAIHHKPDALCRKQLRFAGCATHS